MMNEVLTNPMIAAVIVLIGFGAVATGANQVLKFIDWFKEKPPANQTYATKTEFGRLECDVQELEESFDLNMKEIRSEMRADKKEIMDAGEKRVIALHNRINELVDTSAATQEAANSCKDQLRELTRLILLEAKK